MAEHQRGLIRTVLTGTLPSMLTRPGRRNASSLGRAFVNLCLSATQQKYNCIMKSAIEQRIAELSEQIQSLHNERQQLEKRDSEIEIRLHQLVGAIYEMQRLIENLDRQPLVPGQEIEVELPSRASPVPGSQE